MQLITLGEVEHVLWVWGSWARRWRPPGSGVTQNYEPRGIRATANQDEQEEIALRVDAMLAALPLELEEYRVLARMKYLYNWTDDSASKRAHVSVATYKQKIRELKFYVFGLSVANVKKAS